MKRKTILFFIFSAISKLFSQETSNVFTSDITNFWTAYDKIITTKDSAEQYTYLNDLFIQKGTEGLKAIMELKRYTPKSYINAINRYPLYWQSIRENTFKAGSFAQELAVGIDKLKAIYPDLKPANIYFTVGALNTGGTTYKGKVLIGSEIAMTDKNTVTKELPALYSYLAPYFATNPIKETVFLNIHEYVHTQQTPNGGYDLVSECVHEGIAEYLAVLALKRPSPNQCIDFGKKNDARIKAVFEKELFASDLFNWLYNDFNNEFKARDLGYYVGYAIAEKYYKRAKNKQKAVKEMIDLDLQNKESVEAFIEKSRYFNKPIKELRAAYEKRRPTVLTIKGFKNGDQNVNPNLKTISVEFSEKMDNRFWGFQKGALGEAYFLKDKKNIRFSEDGKTVSFEVELKPNQQYQLVLSESFMTDRAISLVPYLIEFKTGDL